jgi:hypothetical protein
VSVFRDGVIVGTLELHLLTPCWPASRASACSRLAAVSAPTPPTCPPPCVRSTARTSSVKPCATRSTS